MIEIQGLGLRRGGFLLEGIDLRVEPGECFVVVGPSGAGKTLLVESVLGVHRPDTGRVLVDGQDVTRLPPPWTTMTGRSWESSATFPRTFSWPAIVVPPSFTTMRSPATASGARGAPARASVSCAVTWSTPSSRARTLR